MVKRTPEGSMVSDFRRAVKENIDPIEMVVKSAERELKIMEEIRNFARDFRDKKITLQQFLSGPDAFKEDREETLEEFLEEMLGVPIEVIRF
jgi:predicted DNA-binding transcriptional regulator YafY